MPWQSPHGQSATIADCSGFCFRKGQCDAGRPCFAKPRPWSAGPHLQHHTWKHESACEWYMSISSRNLSARPVRCHKGLPQPVCMSANLDPKNQDLKLASLQSLLPLADISCRSQCRAKRLCSRALSPWTAGWHDEILFLVMLINDKAQYISSLHLSCFCTTLPQPLTLFVVYTLRPLAEQHPQKQAWCRSCGPV